MSLDLDAIRQRADAATPGPWTSTDRYPHIVFQCGEEYIVSTNLAGNPLADAEFIAHAREDIPALLAEIDRLTGLVAAMRDALEAMAQGVKPDQIMTDEWDGLPYFNEAGQVIDR